MKPMRLKNRARKSTGDYRAAEVFTVQCREPASRLESAEVSEISPPPTTKRPRAIPRINIKITGVDVGKCCSQKNGSAIFHTVSAKNNAKKRAYAAVS